MAKQDQELNVYEHFKHKTTTGEYYFLTIIDDNGVQTINLSTEDKEDYAIMYRLLGESVSFKFVQFETDMAEDLMKYLRLYFANKMHEIDSAR